MMVFLETERLILRRLTLDDVDNLYALDSDPEVMRYLSGGAPTPREMIAQEVLPRFMSYYDRSNGLGFWAAIEKSTGDFLGWFGLHPEDDAAPDVLSLGYRLRRAAWGKGYATEGARALIRKGFESYGAVRVTATTYQDNLASRRVMEKLGMTLTRTFRPTLADLMAIGTYYIAPDEAEQMVWDGDDVEYTLARADFELSSERGAAQQAQA